MTDFTVQPNGTYEIGVGDRLLLPSHPKTRDIHNVAIAKGATSGLWRFEYPVDGALPVFSVKDSAALRFDDMEGSLYAYTLPVVEVEVAAEVTTPTRSAQRNGTSLSNSQNGYYENVQTQVAPYVLDGGARAMRVPVKHQLLFKDNVIQDAIMLNGYMTKQWLALKAIIDFNIANDVVTVIDDHTYLAYNTPIVVQFWLALGAKLLATYGATDMIVLELQNETSQGGWDANYGTSLKDLVQAIRGAGIPYPVIAGWGGWNSIGGHVRALAEIDAVGGVSAIDPTGKLWFSAHDYPTTSGNDQPTSGNTVPKIKGNVLSTGWKTIFDEFKRRGLKLWITEIGMGGGARAWLANGSTNPAFDGKAWFEAFTALVKQYPDTVGGVLAWGGGQAWKDEYPFKQEYAKGDWTSTKSTEFWRMITAFWNN